MIGITLLECESCKSEYRKGTGHLCWCPECDQTHKICNSCYLEAKTNGDIIDKTVDPRDIKMKDVEKMI